MGLKSRLGWLLAILPKAVRERSEPTLEKVDLFLDFVVLPTWEQQGLEKASWWERAFGLLPTLMPMIEAFVQKATQDPDFIFRLIAKVEQAFALLNEHPELLSVASKLMEQVIERASGQAESLYDYLSRPETSERALELLGMLETLVQRWIDEATSRLDEP